MFNIFLQTPLGMPYQMKQYFLQTPLGMPYQMKQ